MNEHYRLLISDLKRHSEKNSDTQKLDTRCLRLLLDLDKAMTDELNAHYAQDWYSSIAQDGERLREKHLISPAHAIELVNRAFAEKDSKV